MLRSAGGGGSGSVAIGSVTGLGTGVATALAVNVGSAGAPVVLNGALGTPSSGTLTNATGLPAAGVVGTAAVLGANTFTGNQTLTAVNLLGTGTANRIGTATTNDAAADWMMSASATTTKGLVVQSKASNTVSPFQVQYSDGTAYFDVQRDGNVVIDQKFGNVASKPLQLKYSGSEVASVNYLGQGSFNNGLTVGGFFTVSSAGAVATTVDITGRHLLGTGTSPTVTGNGSSNGSIAGKDAFSKVTVGTGTTTSIVITFGTAYATAPVCVVNAQTTTTPINVVTTTTTATLTCAAFTAGEVLHVVCGGF